MDIITNSTIYLGKNLFGKASTITCPDIEVATTEIKTGFGTYDLPTGINAMKSAVTLTGFDTDVFLKVSNPFKEINMTVYGSIDSYNNESLQGSKQAKLVLRGSSRKFSLLGELKQQENIEQPIDFSITAAKLYIEGVEKYHVDVVNHIWKIEGKDILADLKNKLALN